MVGMMPVLGYTQASMRDALDPGAGIQLERLQATDLPVTFGRFVLLGVLGEGAMGRVFRAELTGPSGFRKPTAIKVMRKSVGADAQEFRQALVKEARIGAMLKHRNIVEVYDFGDIGQHPFISMELVDGVGLDRILKAGPLPAPLALDFAVQLCAGLDHAHRGVLIDGQPSPVVHRDLKPSNILVDRDGHVRIMDFGIAKAAAVSGIVTATGMTRGTPSYMSPEQVRGRPLDGRSDLFAVGAVLFEAITGRQLFRGATLLQTLNLITAVESLLARPETLAPVDAAVSGLGGILRRALRADREMRFKATRDMATALAALRGLPHPVTTLADRVREVRCGSKEPVDVTAETREAEAISGFGSTVPSAPALGGQGGGSPDVEPADAAPPAYRTDEIASLSQMEALNQAAPLRKPFRLTRRVPPDKK